MNLRCGFCQNPYTLGRTEILAALQQMDTENLTHYDAHCPRCRRATPILRQKLEMAMPNWKEELKVAVKQPAAAPIQPAEARPVQEMKKAPEKPAAKPSAKKTGVTPTAAKKPARKRSR